MLLLLASSSSKAAAANLLLLTLLLLTFYFPVALAASIAAASNVQFNVDYREEHNRSQREQQTRSSYEKHCTISSKPFKRSFVFELNMTDEQLSSSTKEPCGCAWRQCCCWSTYSQLPSSPCYFEQSSSPPASQEMDFLSSSDSNDNIAAADQQASSNVAAQAKPTISNAERFKAARQQRLANKRWTKDLEESCTKTKKLKKAAMKSDELKCYEKYGMPFPPIKQNKKK
jgi:hypothetical protein